MLGKDSVQRFCCATHLSPCPLSLAGGRVVEVISVRLARVAGVAKGS